MFFFDEIGAGFVQHLINRKRGIFIRISIGILNNACCLPIMNKHEAKGCKMCNTGTKDREPSAVQRVQGGIHKVT